MKPNTEKGAEQHGRTERRAEGEEASGDVQ